MRYGLSASAFNLQMSLTRPCGIPYLLIVKAMYIKQSEHPLSTFRMDCNTKLALVICTAGILLFGVVSCVYDWIAAAAL